MLTLCPSCRSSIEAHAIESHFDRIGQKTYQLFSCFKCGVVFSEPREEVGPNWYEKAAPIRDLEPRSHPKKDWRYQIFFKEHLPPGNILDVGCGDGGFLLLARAKGFKVFGVDYDSRMIAIAKERGIDRAESAEFKRYFEKRHEGEFDVVTLFDVLEHTPEPAQLLEWIKPLIKPGGYIAITLPNALRPLPWGREEHDYPPHHFTRWTPDAMKNFINLHGFSIIHQEAGTLKLRYLSDSYFFFVFMPPLLRITKKIIFRNHSDQKTISELYQEIGAEKPTLLSNKLLRQKIINTARFLFQIALTPIWVLLRFRYLREHPMRGDCLYTLAQKGIS